MTFKLPHLNFDTLPPDIKRVNTQPPVILVNVPHLLTQSDSVSLLPIKPIITEEKTFEDYLWILYILGGLLLLGILAFVLFKRRQVPEEIVEEVVIKRPSHVVALEKTEWSQTGGIVEKRRNEKAPNTTYLYYQRVLRRSF